MASVMSLDLEQAVNNLNAAIKRRRELDSHRTPGSDKNKEKLEMTIVLECRTVMNRWFDQWFWTKRVSPNVKKTVRSALVQAFLLHFICKESREEVVDKLVEFDKGFTQVIKNARPK